MQKINVLLILGVISVPLSASVSELLDPSIGFIVIGFGFGMLVAYLLTRIMIYQEEANNSKAKTSQHLASLKKQYRLK